MRVKCDDDSCYIKMKEIRYFATELCHAKKTIMKTRICAEQTMQRREDVKRVNNIDQSQCKLLQIVFEEKSVYHGLKLAKNVFPSTSDFLEPTCLFFIGVFLNESEAIEYLKH